MLNRIVTLLLVFSASVFADDPEFQEMRGWPLEEKIEHVQSFAPDDRSPEWRTAMKALYYGFAEYSVKWQGNVNGLQELREQVEPLRSRLLDLGYSKHEPDRFYAIAVGKYLKIDHEVEKMFFNVLDESVGNSGQSQNEALDVIFGYGLETPELRQELVAGLSDAVTAQETSRFPRVAAGRSGRWGLHEASEHLIEMVERNYQTKGNVQHGALKSLKELGPAALSVLPRLEALLEERKKDGNADFRELEALEYAIFNISGKIDPRQLEAQKRKLEHVSENDLESPKPKAKLSQTSTEKENPLTWISLILGAFILGGIGVLVWNSRKGSSAS